MQKNVYIVLIWLVASALTAQNHMPTVPTAIYVGNAAFHAPIHGAKVSLTLQEDFGTPKRPISTFIGEFTSDTAGMITVSLVPNKNYLVQTSKDGYYTQLSKIKTTNFSRTYQNKKGISLRPRNVISIKGNIAIPKGTEGHVKLTDKTTNYTRIEALDDMGNYDIKAVKGNNYELHVFIEGMIDTVININKQQLSSQSGEVPLVYNFVTNAPKPNYRLGDTLTWTTCNLRFIDRTHRLSSEIWLDTLARILDDNAEVKMKVQIHTDSRKSDRLNLILSKKRATTVREELIERGISEQQFFFELKGEDEILNGCVDGTNCSKREHAINNRVVLIVAEGTFLFKEDD